MTLWLKLNHTILQISSNSSLVWNVDLGHFDKNDKISHLESILRSLYWYHSKVLSSIVHKLRSQFDAHPHIIYISRLQSQQPQQMHIVVLLFLNPSNHRLTSCYASKLPSNHTITIDIQIWWLKCNLWKMLFLHE